MACSQFLPDVRIGYLYTYWGPLGFVLTVTICREAVDDIRRHQRDREVNSQKYRKCVGPDKPLQMVSSSKLKVNTSIIYVLSMPSVRMGERERVHRAIHTFNANLIRLKEYYYRSMNIRLLRMKENLLIMMNYFTTRNRLVTL